MSIVQVLTWVSCLDCGHWWKWSRPVTGASTKGGSCPRCYSTRTVVEGPVNPK